MMLKEKRDFLAGNNLFEGYLADILAELSKALGFTYEIRITRDGRYGSVGPNDTWSGMIGEVVNGVSQTTMYLCLTLTTLKYLCINHGDQRVYFNLKSVYIFLVSSFCFIWIPTLLVHCHYTIFNSLSVGIDFRRQNLTSNVGPHAERVKINGNTCLI